jgi:hypothetical protein
MAGPRDQKLFALSSAVVKDGLAFIDRLLAAKRNIKPYDNWPSIRWSQGMPEFTFDCDAPIDYTDAVNPIWTWLFAETGRESDIDRPFDFDKHEAYRELKQYIRSEPRLASQLLPSDTGQEHQVDWAGHLIRSLLEHAIDRYIHVTHRTSFDPEIFLEVYLPLEAGLLLEELPIEIHVPILLVNCPSDSYDLGDVISITRMPEPIQLARARRDHDTHDVNEYLLQQASHALVLRELILPNSDFRRRLWGYDVSQPTRETIDTFFACLRIVTSIETGYAQVLFVPVGWAHRYAAGLPPLEGLTTRKYPPNLKPVSTELGGEFPKISNPQVGSVRSLFMDISSIQNAGGRNRLRLAIKRLNSCYMREEQEDAILDATIGLEALLSDGDTQEVTHKLALRLSALSTLVAGYGQEAAAIFRRTKTSIYPFRSAVVHGNEKKANKARELKTETGEAIPAVKFAIEYLGMAIRAVAAHPAYLDPAVIDERLLLGALGRSLGTVGSG